MWINIVYRCRLPTCVCVWGSWGSKMYRISLPEDAEIFHLCYISSYVIREQRTYNNNEATIWVRLYIHFIQPEKKRASFSQTVQLNIQIISVNFEMEDHYKKIMINKGNKNTYCSKCIAVRSLET